MTYGAINHLVDKEAHVRTAAGGALANASERDVGWGAREVKAAESAGDDLKARQGATCTAVGGAVDATLKLIFFTDPVAAHRTDPAVRFTAGAVLGRTAPTVTAAHAHPTVIRAGEAVLNAGGACAITA